MFTVSATVSVGVSIIRVCLFVAAGEGNLEFALFVYALVRVEIMR